MSRKKPRFERYHSERVLRLLARECVASEIGPEACWMLTCIVGLQHIKSYRSPVTFYNSALMAVLGIGSDTKLRRVRQRAIDAGWLSYQAGNKSVVGRYEVVIPKHLRGAWDGPIDESGHIFDDSASHQVDNTETAKVSSKNMRQNEGQSEGQSAGSSGVNPQVQVTTFQRNMNKAGAARAADSFPSMKPPRLYFDADEGLCNLTDDYVATLRRKYPSVASVHVTLERVNQWLRRRYHAEGIEDDFNFHGLIVTFLSNETQSGGNAAQEIVRHSSQKVARNLQIRRA